MSIRACSLGSGISANRNSQTKVILLSNKYRLFSSPRSLRIIAYRAGVSIKARKGNETASKCSTPHHFSQILSHPDPLAGSLVRSLRLHGKGRETAAVQARRSDLPQSSKREAEEGWTQAHKSISFPFPSLSITPPRHLNKIRTV